MEIHGISLSWTKVFLFYCKRSAIVESYDKVFSQTKKTN